MNTKIGLEHSQEKQWDGVWRKRNFYARIVDFGRRVYVFFFRRVLKRYLHPKAEMLELGCGTSMLAVTLSPLAGKIIGLDISPASLELSRRNATNAGARNMEFVLGDCKHLDFHDTFDLVWSNGLLEHFEDPVAVAREHFKALKPGGAALIAVPYYYSYHKLWYAVSRPKILRFLWLWQDVEQIFFTKKMLREVGASVTPNYRVFFLQPFLLGMVFLELRK